MLARLIDHLSLDNTWDDAVDILAALPGNY